LSALSSADVFLSLALEHLQTQLHVMASQVEPGGVSVGTPVPPTYLDTISISLPPLRDGERTGQGRASYSRVTVPSTPECGWRLDLSLYRAAFPQENHRSGAHLLGFLGAAGKKKHFGGANPWQPRLRGRGPALCPGSCITGRTCFHKQVLTRGSHTG